MKAIDLFAGAGGFSTGATMAGVRVVWAATHSHTDQIRIARVLRQRGHAIAGDIGKAYPRKESTTC